MRKTRITSWASTPSAAHTSPISLAKHTLSAWKALAAYLTISAVGSAVWTNGACTSAYSAWTSAAVSASSQPTRVSGGEAKSLSDEPSRMNSGFTATRTQPAASAPAALRSAGINRRSVVPGSTVLRSTTVYGLGPAPSARPISSPTRSMAAKSGCPLERDGVPTQIRARWLSATASAALVVARSRPFFTISAMSSPSPGSTSGDSPRPTAPTLSGFTSTPMTSWPARARQAAVTHPTYPSPKTLTRMVGHRVLANGLELTRYLRPGVALLHQPAARRGELTSPLGIAEQGHHRVGELGRLFGLEIVLARGERKPLGAHLGSDHRFAHGQRLEDLEARTAADPKGHHVNLPLGQMRADILHGTRELDSGRRRSGLEPRARIAPRDGQGSLRRLAPDQGPDGPAEVEDGILVRVPVHGSGEDEPALHFRCPIGSEIVHVHPRRHRIHSGARRQRFEHPAVLLGDRDRRARPRADPRLVAPHLPPFQLERQAPPRPPLRAAEAPPDQVLDIVGEEHDGHARLEWHVRGGSQKVGHAQIH